MLGLLVPAYNIVWLSCFLFLLGCDMMTLNTRLTITSNTDTGLKLGLEVSVWGSGFPVGALGWLKFGSNPKQDQFPT